MIVARHEVPAPQGLQDSAQGFNPGNPQNKRFALKGARDAVPDEARTYCRAKVSGYNWDAATIGSSDIPLRLVRTFDLAPPSGRVAVGGRFPGLKPWAESSSPFGAKTNLTKPQISPITQIGGMMPGLGRS